MAAGDIVRWISNVSTAWSTGANWDSGSAPVAGELVLFDGTGQANVAGGDESTTFQLRSITTQPEYTGNIGASGSPLIHNIDTVSSNPESFLTIRGTGDFYWQAGGAGVGGDENYAALVDTKGTGTVFLDSDTSTGNATSVHVKSGNVIIAGALASQLTLAGNRANVTLNAHAVAPVHVWITAGTLTSARALTSGAGTAEINMEGGRWVQTALVGSVAVYVGKEARWDYQPSSAVTVGTISLRLNGTLDLSNSNYVTGWSSFVRGSLAREIGKAKQGLVALPAQAGLYMDLRDEYPTGE